MPKMRILILIAALLSLSCNTVMRLSPPPAATPIPNESEAEFAVYRAVIEELFATRQLETLVVMDTTTAGLSVDDPSAPDIKNLKSSVPEVDQALIDSFAARNAQPSPLENRFNLEVPVVLLSQAELDDFFGKSGAGWEAFYQTYPQSQGVLTLSRVGFNARGDKALVYAGNMAYSLAGAGYALVLGWEDGQWQVLNQVMLWIS